MRHVLLSCPLVLAACLPAAPPDEGPVPTSDRDPRIVLPDAEAQAHRISMALLGRRPAPAELDALRADPLALDDLIDAWLDDPGVGTLVREMYAEVLLTRSYELRMPALGPLAGTTHQQRVAAVSEEPLAILERVVTEDLPFSEVVTGDWTVLDRQGAAMWDGHDHDPDGPDVQVVRWTDGRPPAGILGSNGLWTRHPSNGANYNRGRANLISRALLCEDFFSRDVPITADIDLTDDAAVANAVKTRGECISCHQALDPLAAHLWTMTPNTTPSAIALSELLGCPLQPFDLCYPVSTYVPALALAPLGLGLRGTGYFGKASQHMGTLGEHIAEDPRFARCAAETFYGYLTQTEEHQLDPEVIAGLQRRFTAGGMHAKHLLRDVLTHPTFLGVDAPSDADTRLAGPQLVRPWQAHAMVTDLTGFAWGQKVDGFGCDVLSLDCYGDVELLHDDVFGFRAMAGGVDGARVTRSVTTPTPTGLLVHAAHAEEAAGFTVARDLGDGPALLLTEVDATTTDPAALRAQLVLLHDRVLAEPLPADHPEIDATLALWTAVHDASADTRRAWAAVLTAMLRDPRALTY